MLYEIASVTTGLFYNFTFVEMKEPNKLLKLKLNGHYLNELDLI